MSFRQFVPAINFSDTIRKAGMNKDVDSAANEDVIGQGGFQYFPSSAIAAASIDIVSDSTDDDTGGIGAITIFLEGIDGSRAKQSETITLDGTTDVHPDKDYLFINQCYVVISGSNQTNVGNITIDDGTTTMAYIGADDGAALQAAYSVPLDYQKAYLTQWYGNVAGTISADVHFHLKIRNMNESWRVIEGVSISNGSIFTYNLIQPTLLAGGADLRLEVNTNANNVGVHGGFSLMLIP